MATTELVINANAVLRKIPKRLSTWLRHALDDLEKVEKAKAKYRVNMDVWHDVAPDGKCEVCLAGSVIAQTLKVDPRLSVSPGDLLFYNLPRSVTLKLSALNYLRVGDVSKAADHFYRNDGDAANCRRKVSIARQIEGKVPFYPPYEEDKRGFKKGMRAVQAELAKVGL